MFRNTETEKVAKAHSDEEEKRSLWTRIQKAVDYFDHLKIVHVGGSKDLRLNKKLKSKELATFFESLRDGHEIMVARMSIASLNVLVTKGIFSDKQIILVGVDTVGEQ